MGLRIKELREAKGLSQAALGEMAGISRSQLSEIENEVKPANTLRLSRLAKALGVSVEDLFTGGSDESYRAIIIDLMKDMEPEDRESILSLARRLARKDEVAS